MQIQDFRGIPPPPQKNPPTTILREIGVYNVTCLLISSLIHLSHNESMLKIQSTRKLYIGRYILLQLNYSECQLYTECH